jgi:adenine-specific DNA-methyltransferase
MAALNDLINQVQDKALRERLMAEAARLTKQKKFGLVFEEHIPECTPLYGIEIKCGSTVAKKAGAINDMYRVTKINGGDAVCLHLASGESETIALSDLVPVAKFGEPIYPTLQPIDKVENAPDSDLWHTLIEADNYHALQLLEYLYPQKVDCIYIDPPYNTGARDWKYNNDYVDSSDSYRHSKWLSMMEKRLKIAKRLLNPAKSVMIITIDEKEYHHLACLLEEMFPEARIQMISTMINPAVVAREGGFGRSGEYIFYLFFGSAAPVRTKLDREWVSNKGRTHTGNIRWDLLKRSGTGATRKDSPGGFYPIYIDVETGRIEKIGDPLPEGISEATQIDGLYCLLPIRDDGSEGRWQWATNTLIEGIKEGRVKVGGNKERGFTVYRLAKAEYEKVKNGEFEIIGHGINNEILVADIDTESVMAVPGDIWKIASHDSTQYGSRLLGNIFGSKRFTFPKSIYAVKDCIRFVTANKPNALIVDFFAGSGTTLHAVNLLNAEDGGHRRCIMVTNNEVSADEAKSLTEQGFQPGDPEWEKLGIARYVTWPRTVCSIEGHDINGVPLKGDYLANDADGNPIPMSQGFKANCEYFKLGFLDKDDVALGRQFKEILPLLWLKAGAVGKRPELHGETPDMLILPENKLAILVSESSFMAFAEQLDAHPEIDTVFIVTDSEKAYREMISGISAKHTYQLYRSYLDNFRINARR